MEHDKNAEIAKYMEQLTPLVDSVNEELFDNIVKGVSNIMFNRDASLVSCSDESELDTIKNGFIKKHLGLEWEEAENILGVVCSKMSGVKFKYRAVFYYLLAEEAGSYK